MKQDCAHKQSSEYEKEAYVGVGGESKRELSFTVGVANTVLFAKSVKGLHDLIASVSEKSLVSKGHYWIWLI